MEDSRRPFTPFIQSDSPTPETSRSPRERGRKSSKTGNAGAAAAGNASDPTSPSRKNLNAAKESTAKDSRKEPVKGVSTPAKKPLPPAAQIKDSVEDPSPTKLNTKGLKPSKPGKSATNNEFLESSIKLSPNEFSDLGTNRTVDNDNAARPDSQSQMRAESSLSHHAPSIITESGYIPFSVEPAFGKLEPGKSQSFKVKFAPLNLNDYQARLLCQIPNTEDGKVGPMIAVKGRGLLPYCHVELEESDYITAGRRDPDLPGPGGAASGLGLDPMIKVIEFNCIGLESNVKKSFDIINPTSVDYGFEWLKDDDQNDCQKHNQFICHQSHGILHGGKKFTITFEFEPSKIGIVEDFWKFKIPQYDLVVPFVLVGQVSEPKVIFDRSHVLFKPLFIGKKGRELVHLINQENKQLEYTFDQASCYTEGRSSVIIVEPSSGVLPPNSKTPIELHFQPREQRPYVFTLKCKISNSSKPLNLNVKSEGFSMMTSLFCEDTNSGNKIEFSDASINEIHMGEVEKNETCFRNLYIFNSGKYTVNFEWFLSSQYEDALSCFSIEPPLDMVAPGDKRHCVLKYTARLERSTIANLILKVENGSIYHVHLDGIAVRPDLHFSFTHFDFGPCFIYKAGMKLKSTMLQLTNRGNKDLNVSCLTELANSCFQFDFKQLILAPGKSSQTKITFIPRENKSYQEKILFELNGLTRREINLIGLGAQLRIELLDPKQKVFDIGTLQIGKTSKKEMQIINRSVAPIDFNLLFEPKSELLGKDKNVIQIEPSQNIQLKPNQIAELQFKFSPKFRIPKFVEDLNVEYNGLHMPLCSIQGACHGYNIWLDFHTVSFGAISQKCSATKRLIMHNDGDIGASFKWDLDRMKPEFSIYPVVGYISPGMEVNFDIRFHPSELAPDLRRENIQCLVEGIKPLAVTLSGSCVQVVPQKETHFFDTFVRQKETKQIAISNRTNTSWDLKPMIEGEYFSGLETFVVEAQSTMAYEVTYFPMAMCGSDGKKHSGKMKTLIFIIIVFEEV